MLIIIILFVLLLMVEVYHDSYYEKYVLTNYQYHWYKARIAKLIKFVGILIALSILLLIENGNPKFVIIYLLLRFFLFDFIYNLFNNRPIDPAYLIKHHELYYWWQIIRHKRKA